MMYDCDKSLGDHEKITVYSESLINVLCGESVGF